MENASKALIIAGAILISILLISVGILVFNSAKGTTDNAGSTGDAMEVAEISARAKIILETSDIRNPKEFNNFIKNRYGIWRELTKEDVIELCEMVIYWTEKMTGSKKHTHNTTYISCSTDPKFMVYQLSETQHVVYDRLRDNEKYRFDDWQIDNNAPNDIAAIYIVKYE